MSDTCVYDGLPPTSPAHQTTTEQCGNFTGFGGACCNEGKCVAFSEFACGGMVIIIASTIILLLLCCIGYRAYPICIRYRTQGLSGHDACREFWTGTWCNWWFVGEDAIAAGKDAVRRFRTGTSSSTAGEQQPMTAEEKVANYGGVSSSQAGPVKPDLTFLGGV